MFSNVGHVPLIKSYKQILHCHCCFVVDIYSLFFSMIWSIIWIAMLRWNNIYILRLQNNTVISLALISTINFGIYGMTHWFLVSFCLQSSLFYFVLFQIWRWSWLKKEEVQSKCELKFRYLEFITFLSWQNFIFNLLWFLWWVWTPNKNTPIILDWYG